MTINAVASNSSVSSAEHFGERYEILGLLGRGGMASVYRVLDLSTHRHLALKQLTVDPAAPPSSNAAALFEQEFHTLAQLRHPHVISVYDYGLSPDGEPYYTMELLDGGDVSERAPLPWPQVCSLFFDVCSSLALLHSRRLLHRDISPRNVRCTQAGSGKLIDFGAMAPMSAGGGDVVGTPAFIAPESVHRMALDARTDLYSLGATLYFALTARVPYAARSFAELMTAWTGKVPAPSSFVKDIPAALDDLVMALISLEPTLRPQSAFAVMQQLAACAGLPLSESDAVSRAYLATPTLVGRAAPVQTLHQKLLSARMGRGGGVWLSGAPGIGRSRLLDACVLEAKTLGFTVLRATATGSSDAFAIAHRLTQQLLDALPNLGAAADYPVLFAARDARTTNDVMPEQAPRLVDLAVLKVDDPELPNALRRLLVQVSRTRSLLIAVDDVHRIDAPSAAVLAELIDSAPRKNLLVALTVDREESRDEITTVLARGCQSLPLEALTREETHDLLGSLFGDVANLEMLADEVYKVSLGNPRQCMDLAQHLVDRGSISYAAGTWTLPQRLSNDDMPSDAAAAMRVRIAGLSIAARVLAEAQALALYESLTDRDYRALLPDASSVEIEQALTELLSSQALLRDGARYILANRVWRSAFLADLDAETIKRRHSALAEMYTGQGTDIAVIHHSFAAGLCEQGLAALNLHHDAIARSFDHRALLQHRVGEMIWCFDLAIETAQKLGQGPRRVNEMRQWQYGGAITTEHGVYTESTRLWFEQLAHDSGLTLYREDASSSDPTARLTKALTAAHQRYLATPEPERVYSVEEAIRALGFYVVCSIAIGSRTQDTALIRSLPSILQPFAVLSPVLDAIWKNSRAVYATYCECDYELARDLWREVLPKLEGTHASELQHVEALTNAVVFGIGLMEVQLGLATATQWAERLDHDPWQRVSGLNLRQIVRLEQGDSHGADRLRREAELLSLQMGSPQMFKSLLVPELAAHVKARDLAGIAQVLERIRPLAARFPGWAANLINGEGYFQLVRGDFEAAKAKFEACIALTNPDAQGSSSSLAMWIAAHAGLAETMLSTGRSDAARDIASSAVARFEARANGGAWADVVRMLALAEAALGDARGAERVEALIARQQELGVTGLWLGLACEARAQIAIRSGDSASFAHYALLTAREYRQGSRSPLAARYERLMNEATRHGLRPVVSLASFADAPSTLTSSASEDPVTMVMRNMANKPAAGERAQMALQLTCIAHQVTAGHLYLVDANGLELRATQGADAPSSELAAAAQALLQNEQRRAVAMDDMATGELLDEAATPHTVSLAGASYDLRLLSCLIDEVSTLVGVVALEANSVSPPTARQNQLLQALALYLVRAGDSAGVQLST